MTKQITLEEALKLVSFYHSDNYGWQVRNVNNNVYGNVDGSVFGKVDGSVIGSVCGAVGGSVRGNVVGDVEGDVNGNVSGNVKGKINGCEWQFVETPKDKLQRLITESGNQELIDTFNQQENN